MFNHILNAYLDTFLPSKRGSEHLGYYFLNVMILVALFPLFLSSVIGAASLQPWLLIPIVFFELLLIPTTLTIHLNFLSGLISKLLQLLGVSKEKCHKFEDFFNIGLHVRNTGYWIVRKVGGGSFDEFHKFPYAVMYSDNDYTGLTEDEVRDLGYQQFGMIANRTLSRGEVFDSEYGAVLSEIKQLKPASIVILISKKDANVSSSYLKGRLELDTSLPVEVQLV